jgi:RecJ-like exonuclease
MCAMAESIGAGWFGPGVLLRQAPAPMDDDGDEDTVVCPQCDGTGSGGDGYPCSACGGTGRVPADDDGRAARRDGTTKSGSRSSPTIADLELRLALARSRAQEEEFYRDYGDQLARVRPET